MIVQRVLPLPGISGFTLIELLLTTILFAVSFFPILDTFASSSRSLADDEVLMKGWLTARNTIEEAASLPFGLLETGEQKETVAGESYDFVQPLFSQQEEDVKILTQVGYADDDNQFTNQKTELKLVQVRLFIRNEGDWKLAHTLSTLKFSGS